MHMDWEAGGWGGYFGWMSGVQGCSLVVYKHNFENTRLTWDVFILGIKRFCGSRWILFGGKMALLMVKVSDPWSRSTDFVCDD